jgi:hypothetical protein
MAASGGDLSSSSLGDGVWFSDAPLATGKTPMGAADSSKPGFGFEFAEK